eukprot:TRINITY_DN1161_c0_g1_i4.p3 TRINITY_DN1161_c0_g1~~TRINITY_DN1161_c0_g1_i4.p3  ORF type:complete len:118 (+),score=42.06 TRINITY_DN1161_c0_g1_i4:98-451(+)
MQTILKRNHIKFDWAKNGLMAVDKYDQAMRDSETYVMIFMDLEMPMMDGYEATVKIREIERDNGYRPTLICALSAYTDEKVKKRCMECGMDDYLSKPLNMELMLQMIAKELENIRQS